MELLDFFKKNPENFDTYVYELKNTVNTLDKKTNKYSDSIPKKTIIYSLISFTFGFFISKYLRR